MQTLILAAVAVALAALLAGYMLRSRPTGPRVAALSLYPVKSCAPLRVQSARFDRLGFVHDRRWMVVSDPAGQHASQREYPRMALIQPKLDEGRFMLTLTMPGEKEELSVPLYPQEGEDTVRRTVRVFDEEMDALVLLDPAIPAWLSRVLHIPERRVLRLASIISAAEHDRPLQPAYDRSEPSQRIMASFTDQMPFLLVNSKSVSALNVWTKKNGREVGWDIFRPNILVEGAKEAWEEDLWRRIRVTPASDPENAGLEFWCAKADPRCVLTTVDPTCGAFHPSGEPLRSLKQHRTLMPTVPSEADGAIFGQYLVQREQSGVLRVGDHIEILEWKKTPFDPIPEKLSEEDRAALEQLEQKQKLKRERKSNSKKEE